MVLLIVFIIIRNILRFSTILFLLAEENRSNRKSINFNKWRKRIYKQDNYTCQKCFKTNTILHAHHIYNFLSYKELRFELFNGITLCERCHTFFHKTFGKINNNLIQLESFLGRKIDETRRLTLLNSL